MNQTISSHVTPLSEENSILTSAIFRLDLLSPLGGENIGGQSTYNIAWETEIIDQVMIEFSSDNQETWSTIVSSVAAEDSTYSWSVPNINSSECFIRLTTPGLPDLFAINEIPFSIYYTVGTETIEDITDCLKVFPNPAKESVSISFIAPESWNNTCQLEAFNMNGENVINKIVSISGNKNHEMVLNISELPQGIYLIKLTSNGNSISQKFIKN